MYINKANYPEVFKFSDDEKLYNWTTKELLAIMPLKEAKVKADKTDSRDYIRIIKKKIIKLKLLDLGGN